MDALESTVIVVVVKMRKMIIFLLYFQFFCLSFIFVLVFYLFLFLFIQLINRKKNQALASSNFWHRIVGIRIGTDFSFFFLSKKNFILLMSISMGKFASSHLLCLTRVEHVWFVQFLTNFQTNPFKTVQIFSNPNHFFPFFSIFLVIYCGFVVCQRNKNGTFQMNPVI